MNSTFSTVIETNRRCGLYLRKFETLSWRVTFGLIFFIVAVSLKLHTSSIARWDYFLPEKTADYKTSLLLFEPRPIRSDEYIIQTPFYLSQYHGEIPFSLNNELFLDNGQNMLLSLYSPVKHISMFGKPLNWGFFFLDAERGFSWYWCLKLVLIFFFAFEFFYLATKQLSICFLGALGIYYSPVMQWWLSTAFSDLILYCLGIIFSIYHLLKVEKVWKKVLFSIAFVSMACGFCLTIYPTMQVPLTYFSILFLIGMIVDLNLKEKALSSSKYLTLSLIAIVVIVTIYFLDTMQAIEVVRNTVYPGRRFSVGGDGNLSLLVRHITSLFTPFDKVGIRFSNFCEEAGYCVSTFFVIIYFILNWGVIRKSKIKTVLSLVFFLFFIFTLSFFIPWPLMLAKFSLMSFAPSIRLVFIQSFLGFILLLLISSEKNLKKLSISLSALLSLAIVAVEVFIIKSNPNLNSYLKSVELLIILPYLLFYFLMFWGRKSVAYIVLVLIIMASGFFINPLSKGLSPIFDKQVTAKVLELKSENPDAVWVHSGTLYGSSILMVSGVRFFGGFRWHPDLDFWNRMFDKNGENKDVYNRYGHGIFIIEDREDTIFQLQGNDYYQVRTNLEALEEQGVDFILSYGGVDSSQLKLEGSFPDSKMFIYSFR